MEKISNKLIPNKKEPDPYFYEKVLWDQQAYVCGVDEVGRGCLAGPVIAAAVILHPFANHPFLKDSKILSEKKREEVAAWIKKNSWYSYGNANNGHVDTYNVYQATQKAMKSALYNLFSQHNILPKTELILIDAMPLNISHLTKPVPILSFPFGESRSVSIAAASILAKVKRDKLITRVSSFFPGYSFEIHKGYGTKKHFDALKQKGASLMHRLTFIQKQLQGASHEQPKDSQTKLFC